MTDELPPSLITPNRPLQGRRVLVPRAEGSATMLVALLEAAGAQVEAVPLIVIEPPVDVAALDVAVLTLAAGEYDWVAFASANAVAAVLERAAQLAIDPVVPADTRIATVGAATAAALRAAGLPTDLRPTARSSAAGMLEVWPQPTHRASRVLLPASSIGLPTLGDGLSGKGYLVDTVSAYAPRTLPVPDDVAADLRAGRYFAVLLTAPSIVGALAGAGTLHPDMMIGTIGATTAAAAAAAGLTVGFIADQASMAALTDGLIAATEQRGTSIST